VKKNERGDFRTKQPHVVQKGDLRRTTCCRTEGKASEKPSAVTGNEGNAVPTASAPVGSRLVGIATRDSRKSARLQTRKVLNLLRLGMAVSIENEAGRGSSFAAMQAILKEGRKISQEDKEALATGNAWMKRGT